MQGLVHLMAQGGHRRIHLAGGFQVLQDVAGHLVVALLERLRGALDPRLDAARVERRNGFAAQRPLERVRELHGAGVAVARLFGQRLMHHAAHHLADGRVDLIDGRRVAPQDGLEDLFAGPALKRLDPAQYLVTDHAQGIDVRLRAAFLVLDLLRGHVAEGALHARERYGDPLWISPSNGLSAHGASGGGMGTKRR